MLMTSQQFGLLINTLPKLIENSLKQIPFSDGVIYHAGIVLLLVPDEVIKKTESIISRTIECLEFLLIQFDCSHAVLLMIDGLTILPTGYVGLLFKHPVFRDLIEMLRIALHRINRNADLDDLFPGNGFDLRFGMSIVDECAVLQ